jgi:menaquinone-dependent protoporphyrinogen oxidase
VSRILVAYASKHGATAEIADAVADELRQAGHEVDCLSAEQVEGLDVYDATVIGSAVYMKRWRPEARRLLKRHGKELASHPFWVFSSGPFGKNPDPSWSEPPRTLKRAEHLGVRGHVVFGGRLPLEPSNFMERAMVRDCPPDKRDLRDWDEIRAWAAGISRALKSAGGRPRESFTQ